MVALIFGIVLWRNTKFPWLFFDAWLMFGTAGVMGRPHIQNIGEIAFTVGLVTTQTFAIRRAHS